MPDHGYDLEQPYRELGDPLEMSDARRAAHMTAKMRRRAEEELVSRVEQRAELEGAYRQKLAEEIVRQKAAHGSTVAKELAHKSKDVETALVEFKVAEGMVMAAQERLKGLEGERSMLRILIEWSSNIAQILRQTSDEEK